MPTIFSSLNPLTSQNPVNNSDSETKDSKERSPQNEKDKSHTYGYHVDLLKWPAPEPPEGLSYIEECVIFFIKRFRIAIHALPGTLTLLLFRYLLWGEEKDPPVSVIDSTIVPPMIACMSFIMGLVLSNVIADYKESEKVPSEMVAYFRETPLRWPL